MKKKKKKKNTVSAGAPLLCSDARNLLLPLIKPAVKKLIIKSIKWGVILIAMLSREGHHCRHCDCCDQSNQGYGAGKVVVETREASKKEHE